jgi:hypothetical protein
MNNNSLYVTVKKEKYIPLINRVQGPYCKLWTKFFHCLMAQARSAWAIKRQKKQGSITYRTDEQTWLIRCLLYGSFPTMVIKQN